MEEENPISSEPVEIPGTNEGEQTGQPAETVETTEPVAPTDNTEKVEITEPQSTIGQPGPQSTPGQPVTGEIVEDPQLFVTSYVTDDYVISLVHDITLGDFLIATLLCVLIIIQLVKALIGGGSRW